MRKVSLLSLALGVVLAGVSVLPGAGVRADDVAAKTKIVLSATINNDVYKEFGDKTFLYKISGPGLDPTNPSGPTKNYTYYTSITIKDGEKTGSVTVPVWTNRAGDGYKVTEIPVSRFKRIARDSAVVSPDKPTSESTASASLTDASDRTLYFSTKLNTGESTPPGVKFQIIQPDGTPMKATKISDGVYQHSESGPVTEYEPADGLVMIKSNDGDELSEGKYSIKITALPDGYSRDNEPDRSFTNDTARPFALHYALVIGRSETVPYALVNFVYGISQAEMESHSTTVINHIENGNPSGRSGQRAAKPSPTTYQVVYNANGGHFENNMTANKLTYNYADELYTLTNGEYATPTSDEGTFAGWYYDADCTEKATSNGTDLAGSPQMPAGHVLTVYAKWE